MELQRGLNIHLPFIELFDQGESMCVSEMSWLDILMQGCKGFHYFQLNYWILALYK